ncbi:MAG: hypothetical protein IIX93_08725 [Clostridia bacterium]|nr:hypothetical protein [Clostridia bacterium]
MYCVKCGTRAKEGQKKCLACGMRLISPDALLKLLRKADLEKKLSLMDETAPEKSVKSRSFVEGYMDRLHKDEQEASALKKKKPNDEIRKKETVKTKKPDTKTAVKPKKAEGEKERKRVTPLFENPTQPKSRSIFDDEPVKAYPKKAKTVPHEKPKQPEKANASVKKAAVKKPEAKRTNPVVKLPEKKKTIAEPRKRPESEKRVSSQRIVLTERDGIRKKSAPARKSSAVKRPDKTRSAAARGHAPVKRQAAAKVRPSTVRPAAKGRKTKRDEENFVEKYLRSIISMMLLTCTVVLMLMWGYATDTGNRTMAELGLGSRQGYILLGDDCMANGNYKRAVEHYYKALSKKVNYEAGIKLARAYRQTGEAEKETSSLLLLMDRYQGREEPYLRLLELFPDAGNRPEKVQMAINMHER